MKVEKIPKRTFLAAAILVSVACGNGGSPSPVAPSVAPSPSPPPQPRANLNLTIYDLSYVSPGALDTADVYYDIALRETAVLPQLSVGGQPLTGLRARV